MAKVKHEKIQDIGVSYGIDVASELESLLAEELSKSIDVKIMKEIMKKVFQAHRDIRKEKSKKILDKIQQMKEKGI